MTIDKQNRFTDAFEQRCAAVWLVAITALMAGCSTGPARVYPPKYGLECGDAAMAMYDTNGNGAIDGDEFDHVPALRAAIKQVDANGDGRITAEEINARVQAWLATRTGEMDVNCDVSLDGKPLTGAQVRFEPELFLGPNVKPGKGESEGGGANISMAPEHLANPRYRGMACGWYKIRVTHPDQQIPERYNINTTLGCEVAMGAHWVNYGTVRLRLTSKSKNAEP